MLGCKKPAASSISRETQPPSASDRPSDSVTSTNVTPAVSGKHQSEVKLPTKEESERKAWFEEMKTTGIHFTFSSGRSDGEFAIIESLGGGVGVFDYDKDGRADLLFAGGGTLANKTVSSRPCGFFRNQGDWHFEEVTQVAGAGKTQCFTHGIFPADLDNDGFDDVAISGYGGVQILHNQGDGTFSALPLLVTHPEFPWSSSLAWADFDRDGVLDLYVAHYVNWSWNHHPSCAGAAVPREVCAPRDFDAVGDAIFFLETGREVFYARITVSGLSAEAKGWELRPATSTWTATSTFMLQTTRQTIFST